MSWKTLWIAPVLAAFAPPPGETSSLRYLGTAWEFRRELADEERVLGRLFTSTRIAYVIVERQSPETRAFLAYPTGQRSLRFAGQRAHFRLLIRTNRSITVRARRGDTVCFTRRITVRVSGVWGLKLPC
jgi:hypothetical protein